MLYLLNEDTILTFSKGYCADQMRQSVGWPSVNVKSLAKTHRYILFGLKTITLLFKLLINLKIVIFSFSIKYQKL